MNHYMPHGHCYLWEPGLVWTHVISDGLIGLAYLSISITLYALVRKIRLPFSPIFIAFGIFIGACGLTHFMEIWTLWYPDYWVSAFFKVVTAIASVITGAALFKIRPNVIKLAESARLSEVRREKLELAHAELARMYDKVRESEVLKTQFFANVSHELRTPIALILGPVERILAKADLAPDERHDLDVVFRNGQTLLKQVNDLLDISKIEAGHLKLRYKKADLVQLFKYTAAHFESIMQTRGLFFALQAPASIQAEVDPEKIQRVMMNLLSNAVKFTPDGGRIRASIQQEGVDAVFTITDTGPGVSAELSGKLFERFSQGEGHANRRFGGTGLGLAIVKDFAEMHGGAAALVQDGSPGATFVVHVPLKAPAGSLVEAALLCDSGGHMEADVIEASVQELRQMTTTENPLFADPNLPIIVVCEDNPDMNRFVAETLGQDFNVVRAVDGRDGLSKIRRYKPSLVVSDIMMPNMSGDQLVSEVRRDETISSTPILLLSARSDDEMRVNLLRNGASDYLIKPFSPEELLVRASNLVSMQRARELLQFEVSSKADNLEALVKDLSEQKNQAEKANRVKSMFLSLVSHELNTPFAAMHLSVQMLAQEIPQLNGRQTTLVNHLTNASKQLKNLIESLLEYVRGGNVLHIETIGMTNFIRETLSDVKSLAEQKNLQVKAGDSEDLQIQTDPRKLRIVLNNLLVNAVKFTEKGFVEVSIKDDNSHFQIAVSDTGLGISDEDKERIFEPFEQVESLSRKTTPGVGLGLALVRQLVADLNGTVSLESQKGQGTTFFVRLPKHEPSPTL